jgi:beta-glucosidase-like glycosyl hydrolase
MARLGARDDVEATFAVGRAIGDELATLGFSCDFSPCVDVATNPQNPVIGDRSFGGDPFLVSRHGVALARGLEAAGVLACAKHYPGHGDTSLDSHLALPRIDAPADRLRVLLCSKRELQLEAEQALARAAAASVEVRRRIGESAARVQALRRRTAARLAAAPDPERAAAAFPFEAHRRLAASF